MGKEEAKRRRKQQQGGWTQFSAIDIPLEDLKDKVKDSSS